MENDRFNFSLLQPDKPKKGLSRPYWIYGSIFGGALIIIAIMAAILSNSSEDNSSVTEEHTEEEPAPITWEDLPLLPGPPRLHGAEQSISSSLGRNQNFANAISSLGAKNDQVFAAISALEKVFDFRKMRPEDQFTLLLNRERDLESITIHTSPIDRYNARLSTDNTWVAEKVTLETQTITEVVGGKIESSLYETVERMGEHPALVAFFVDVFAWDIDFYTDTRQGDEFKVLVEKVIHEGAFIRYGNILAAEYNGYVGRFRSFRYVDGQGNLGHFDDKGLSVQKSFLKTPLKFTRISSGFGKRRHPILQRHHQHLGVDYAAPRGTPVRAIANGRITFSGWKGANGKLVVIKHPNGYESMYGHLNTITSGIRPGTQVRQMQLIGTVGSTGRSTGPHLHFGLKQHGNHINPLKVKAVRDKGITAGEMARFKSATTPLMAAIDMYSVEQPAVEVTGLETGKPVLHFAGSAGDIDDVRQEGGDGDGMVADGEADANADTNTNENRDNTHDKAYGNEDLIK